MLTHAQKRAQAHWRTQGFTDGYEGRLRRSDEPVYRRAYTEGVRRFNAEQRADLDAWKEKHS